jgi:hypothetical protein
VTSAGRGPVLDRLVDADDISAHGDVELVATPVLDAHRWYGGGSTSVGSAGVVFGVAVMG